MWTLAERLRWYRERNGMTQEALALACDPPITQGSISHLENGRRPGRWKTLCQIAQALHLASVEELLTPPRIPVIALVEAGANGYHLDAYPPGSRVLQHRFEPDGIWEDQVT